jgi:hypothetical protein
VNINGKQANEFTAKAATKTRRLRFTKTTTGILLVMLFSLETAMAFARE